MQRFQVRKIIRMQHCDPGGIVFTPQYFNLFVEVIEDWFSQSLDFSFQKMIHENYGIPVMKINAKFVSPSFLGEELDFSLIVKRLREKTVLVEIIATKNEEKKCSGEFLYGFSNLSEKQLIFWLPAIYAKMSLYVV